MCFHCLHSVLTSLLKYVLSSVSGSITVIVNKLSHMANWMVPAVTTVLQ